jgi:hypothetical protein
MNSFKQRLLRTQKRRSCFSGMKGKYRQGNSRPILVQESRSDQTANPGRLTELYCLPGISVLKEVFQGWGSWLSVTMAVPKHRAFFRPPFEEMAGEIGYLDHLRWYPQILQALILP